MSSSKFGRLRINKHFILFILYTFLVVLQLVTVIPTVKAATTDPDIYIHYGDSTTTAEFRTDLGDVPAVLVKYKGDDKNQSVFEYRTGSSRYSTSGVPYIATFEDSSNNTITVDLCDPLRGFTLLRNGSKDEDYPDFYNIQIKKMGTIKGTPQEAKMAQQHQNFINGESAKSGGCPQVSDRDISPLVKRKIKAKVDLDPGDLTEADAKSTKIISAEDVLSKLYFCIQRDSPAPVPSGGVIKNFDETIRTCRKYTSANLSDVLADNDKTQQDLDWASPFLRAGGKYRITVLGLKSEQFNRPFDFGRDNSFTKNFKTSRIETDGDLKIPFDVLLGVIRANKDAFVNGVSEFEKNPDAVAAAASSTSSQTQDDNSCESAGALGWIMCPVINILDGTFNKIDTLIQQLLIVDDSKFRDTDLKHVWSSIRDLSYLILIPIMLVMVISTALGFDFISAYTVKKALPRLVGAVLFIALSWELTGFLITFTNNIGQGLLGFMTSPLGLAGSVDGVTLQDLFKPSAGGAVAQVAGTGAFFSAVAAGVLLSPAILGLVGNILLGGVIIILTAFAVLITRQIFLITLIVAAPVAILAWIFPGNDKLWKLWWGTFSKLLIMYPLIMVLIGSGRIFAYVIGNTQSAGLEGGMINPILKLVAYILPYAMIPLTFKFAGGFVGNLAGSGKGISDWNKKRRAQNYASIKSDSRSGDLFKSRNVFGRQIGGRVANRGTRMARGISMGGKGHFGFGEQGRQAWGGALQSDADGWLKENAQAAKVLTAQDDTAAVLGLSHGHREGAARSAQILRQHWEDERTVANMRRGMNENDARSEAAAHSTDRATRALASAHAIGVNKRSATAALSVMAQNKSRSIGAGRYDLIQDGIRGLADGNAQFAQDAAYNYQYNSRGAGREDLGGDWSSSGSDVADRDEVMMDGLGRTDMPSLVKGHPAQVRQASETLTRAMDPSNDVATKRRAALRLLEMQSNLSYATEDNATIINDTLMGLGIDVGSAGRGGPDVASQLASLVGGTVDGAHLAGNARTFDRETGQRGDGEGGPAGGAGVAPTPPPT